MRLPFLLVLLLASPALAELDSFGLGTGRDGVLLVNTVGRIINRAAPLTDAAPAGSTTLSVSTSNLAAGQLVLIHQSAGLPSTTPSGNTGAVTPGAVGRWELARIQTRGDGTLQLTEPLVNGYSVPGAQVVLVPEYTSVSVSASGSLVAPPWDGSSGGILAFLATGSVANQGLISAASAGFRGGDFTNHEDLRACSDLDQSRETGGSYKGEGLVVERFGTAAGRGNLANAGGGGNCHNSGGGGGGHGGFGGTGGRSADLDGIRDVGGLGGALVRYQAVEQFVFGGGAGGGEGNNTNGTDGGAGGGAVFIRARQFGGNGLYTADGVTPGPTPGDDGAGGGGAGGAVILRAAEVLNCGSARAQGGAGGSVSEAGFALGPGGGGAGGYVLLQGTTIVCPFTVAGGNAGTTAADGGTYGSTYGAGAGGPGISQELLVAYQTPTTPSLTAPASGAVGVSSRPKFQGVADPGVRVFIYVDGVEVVQTNTNNQTGEFTVSYPGLGPALPPGEHTVTLVAEAFATYSQRSTGVTFNVAVSQDDGTVLVAPILVVPAAGESVGPTPLFAGVAPTGVTVGIEVDNGAEVTVSVDSFGRFRYQVPAESPLPPGPHFVTLHAHNEAGDTGPYSQEVAFEALPGDGQTPDAGSGEPDAGSGTDDAGTGGTPDGGSRELPVMVVPADGEVVDPTPLFAGVAEPGASVVIEVDGTKVAAVVADPTGAFRYPVPSDAALAMGAHSVIATQVQGASSQATGFEVRGPANLDVGCGCGASSAGMAGVWALLAGLAAVARRRRR